MTDEDLRALRMEATKALKDAVDKMAVVLAQDLSMAVEGGSSAIDLATGKKAYFSCKIERITEQEAILRFTLPHTDK